MVVIATREDVKNGFNDFIDNFFAAADETAEENGGLPVEIHELIDQIAEQYGIGGDDDFIKAVKYAMGGFYIYGDKIIMDPAVTICKVD